MGDVIYGQLDIKKIPFTQRRRLQKPTDNAVSLSVAGITRLFPLAAYVPHNGPQQEAKQRIYIVTFIENSRRF